jgi:YVTN family beta-propeller protein
MKPLIAFALLVLFCNYPVFQAGAETRAYVPSVEGATDGNVTRIETASEQFSNAELEGDPYGVAVTPDGSFVFITRRPSVYNYVTRIPTSNFGATTAYVDISVGDDPKGVAVEPENEFVYVANFNGDNVSKIDISTRRVVASIAVGDGPLGVAAAYNQKDDTPMVYVTNSLADSLTVIGDNDKTTTIDDVCDEPSGVAVTPHGAVVYVACTGEDKVQVVQTSNNSLTEKIAVGNEPWGVAVGSDGKYVFVTNSGDESVSVIDTSDNTVVDTIPVGDTPKGIAAPRNGDFAYAVNEVGNSIHKITITATDPFEATVKEIGSNQINSAVSIGAFIGDSPPSAPSGLEAEVISAYEIDLTWNDNSSNEWGFKIERREDSEDAFVQIAKVEDDTESYTDDELAGGTTYHYRIRAYNEAADSVASSSAEATTEDGHFSWCFVGTIYE